MKISTWGLRLIVLLALNTFCLQIGFASVKSKSDNIKLEGTWSDNIRSVFPSAINVFATINDKLLSIENMSEFNEITINIVDNNRGIVLTKELTYTTTKFIIISLFGLPTGEYQIELKNQFGGYLIGYINI